MMFLMSSMQRSWNEKVGSQKWLPILLCPVYWTVAMLNLYCNCIVKTEKEELKCAKEAGLMISMHSKAPAGELIAAVPPAEVADVVHGFM